jgi:hypothetical protein
MGWLTWLYNLPLHAWWQWVLSAIAILAFVGWLVTGLLCRPKVRLYFLGEENGQSISCWIQNMPLGKRYFFPRSAIQSLNVTVAIIDIKAQEQGNDMDIVHCDAKPRKIQFNNGEIKETIMLPASKSGVHLPIARAYITRTNEFKAQATNEDGRYSIELYQDEYIAEFRLWVDGDTYRKKRNFKISREKPYVRWVKYGTVKL